MRRRMLYDWLGRELHAAAEPRFGPRFDASPRGHTWIIRPAPPRLGLLEQALLTVCALFWMALCAGAMVALAALAWGLLTVVFT
jgi:hypothetical protein